VNPSATSSFGGGRHEEAALVVEYELGSQLDLRRPGVEEHVDVERRDRPG
jgi:hypothetical protein